MTDVNDLAQKLFQQKLATAVQSCSQAYKRQPVHVVYGGANLFRANTVRKLGDIALKAIETYASDFAQFAKAMWMPNADALPSDIKQIEELEKNLIQDAEKVRAENFPAWLAWSVYNRVIEKLRTEPIEDFRIDFEDGYGFRADEEEDQHAVSASSELAKSILTNQMSPFCGFRIKSFSAETFRRAVRTLDLFLQNFIEKVEGKLPEDFVVNLPKIRRAEEVEILAELLRQIEEKNQLETGKIKIELMIETPEAIFDEKGSLALRRLVEAGQGRVISAHFGAFDYTASFGISGIHQHLRHEACNFARQMMQVALAPLGLRLSDSVTIEMPIPPHKGENLSALQIIENRTVVHQAWRKHFSNVTFSLANGFYQSWDLHPAQLVARYAAVYTFFIESMDEQAKRLKNFIQKATQASMTGNVFDDAASANGLLNFFRQALACGALGEDEILKATGLTAEEIRSLTFQQIVERKT